MDTVDFDHADDALSKDFPEKQPSIFDTKGVCPDRDEVVIDPKAARIGDFDLRMKKIENLLDRRVKGGTIATALMPETIGVLERESRGRINSVFDDIIAKAPKASGGGGDGSSSSNSCIDEEQLMGLIDEGLLALLRRADLRDVLQRKVLELDPSAESVILDADFPMMQQRIPERKSINLRRVLDTSLLVETIAWVDQLVEMIGGYNDRFDQFLDSMASGRESVGEIVVRRLLEESGRVEIPHPKKIIEKVIRNSKVLG
jgi:hypothetical protein